MASRDNEHSDARQDEWRHGELFLTIGKPLYKLISIPTVKSNATHTVDMEALSTLSQYRTEDINPFGYCVINPDRMPEPLEQRLGLSLSPVSAWFGDLCIFYQKPFRHPNLVNDPEVRFTPKGTPVANLSPVTVVGLPTKTQVWAAYLIGAAAGVLSYQGIGLPFAPL